MKAIKITLLIIVLALLGFFAWKWSNEPPANIGGGKSTNVNIPKIQADINALKKSPINRFCLDSFITIQSDINDKFDLGLLADNSFHNEQEKDNLSRELYYAYASKFIEQAKYVFSNHNCDNDKLLFIKKEVAKLQNSTFLSPGSMYAKSLNEFNNALDKYNEIENFIASCYAFGFNDFDIYAQFPIDEVSAKVKNSKSYLANNLDNSYVANCTLLKTELQAIPSNLFNKHVAYLERKKRNYDMDYHSNYKIFYPQINALDGIYGINQGAIDAAIYELRK